MFFVFNYFLIYSFLNKLLIFEFYKLEELILNWIYNKVVVVIDEVYLNECIKEILVFFYECFEIIKMWNNLLEFMLKGIMKVYGIFLLVKDLGICVEEIMILGDEENDLLMIEYVGLGVVMVNVILLVKEVVDVVIDMND